MPLSIVEQLAVKVEARLVAIQSAVSGFDTVLGNVVRPKRGAVDWPENAYGDRDVVLIQRPPEEDEERSGAGNPPVKGWTVEFGIFCVVNPSESDETPIDTHINQYTRDVAKALLRAADGSSDYEQRFDGLASGARLLPPDYDDGTDGGPAAIETGIRIDYQTLENDLATSPGA